MQEQWKYQFKCGYKNVCIDICKLTKGLIDEKQGGLRSEKRCIDQIFTLRQIGEKAWQEKWKVYVGFIDLNKMYDRVNKKAWGRC